VIAPGQAVLNSGALSSAWVDYRLPDDLHAHCNQAVAARKAAEQAVEDAAQKAAEAEEAGEQVERASLQLSAMQAAGDQQSADQAVDTIRKYASSRAPLAT
jgi:hypothetical protein